VDPLAPVKRFDRFQQRHRALAIPLAVIRKFGNDQGGNLAALVAYYAFFSLFPLLLVFVTILGYALQGDHSTLVSVEDSVRRNFPVVDSYLHFTTLRGSALALVIGIATSLWSGLGVTNSAQNAFNRVWAIPFKERPGFLASRLRGLGLLGGMGLLFIVATGASGVVSGGLGGPAALVGGIVVSLLVNVLLFFTAFRLLTAKTVRTRCLWVGVVVAAAMWTILQSVGGIYVGHTLKHLPAAYESFGIVIALLVWLHLGAQVTIYAAELNVVLERHLWPRSLIGPAVEPADRETYTALAKVEERDQGESVEVSFDVGDGSGAPTGGDGAPAKTNSRGD
jgi:membrane protein